MSGEHEVRPSPIAGMWYSSDAASLSRQIDDYLTRAQHRNIHGRIIGLIAPHAGYQYSGLTAAHAFCQVQNSTRDLVVVLSPYHDYHPAGIITSGHSFYETPLGRVAVDVEHLTELDEALAERGIRLARVTDDGEHSLEIELPFLQRALQGQFKLLPLMVRSHNLETLKQLADILTMILSQTNYLLVASTDLSHFYSQEVAGRLDKEMLHQMAKFSPEGVIEAENTGTGFACGAGAVAAMLYTARNLGANAVEVLHHSDSGNETGDYRRVVGYGAAAVYRKE